MYKNQEYNLPTIRQCFLDIFLVILIESRYVVAGADERCDVSGEADTTILGKI